MSLRFLLIYSVLAVLGLLCSCASNETKAVSTPYDSIKADNPIDSLHQVLEIAGQDTFRASALRTLAWMQRRDKPDTALILAKEAVELSDQLNDLRGKSKSNHVLATVYRQVGDYKNAIKHNELALKYATELNDSVQIAASTGNLGTVHFTVSNYPRAMEYYLAALKMGESLHDTLTIATQLGNIGSVLIYRDKPDSAITYYQRALLLDELRHDSAGIAFDLNGIASAYGRSEKTDTALHYYMKAYAIEKTAGTKYGIERITGNIGMCWAQRADTEVDPVQKQMFRDSSIDYYRTAINLARELHDRRGEVMSLGNLGRAYADLRKYDSAEVLLIEAIRISDSLGILEYEKDNEMNLSVMYDSLGRHKDAYIHYKNYVTIHDTLVNEDNSSEMTRAQMNFDFEKEHAVEQARNEEELSRQKLMLNVSLAGGMMFLIIAAVSIRAYRTKKRSNEIISQQKKEVENQKLLVEVKQKEIIDSINYAKRIQSAILPLANEIENLFRNAFVFFKPKDIVSGDFYWMAKTQDYTFIAAADCTGHGVPGGFMSMLGHSMLNEVVLEKQITDTGEILDLLRLKIIRALKQTGEAGENKDGMDIVLCRFDNDFKKLTFSCANNPLWICRDNAMLEFKADKQPVGISGASTMLQFRTQEVDLKHGDCIYIFSDGYPDQFGGPKGKKLKHKGLQDVLLKYHSLPMAGQEQMVVSYFSEWKGNLAQIDDVLLIGIGIP